MFIAQDTDLTVGVQTATRAPFVSLFSGDSIRGRERGSEGFLETKSTETHEDVGQSAGMPTVGHILKHLSQPQESSKIHQECSRFIKKVRRFIKTVQDSP